MEVRAASCYSRVLWEYLDDVPNARLRLRQIFDKFDTLCSLPNFFTPLRLTGLTAAMVRGTRYNMVLSQWRDRLAFAFASQTARGGVGLLTLLS